MCKYFLIIVVFLTSFIKAQENKTLTLTVSGQGQTQDEAKQNALRNAIEQAFGTFISSNTEILNDELVKDEIVSIANGNIQKFDVISEVQIPDGGHAITLKATVSVSKLTSFVESKGVVAELKGSLFAYNINQQKLNETNEAKAISEITDVTLNLLNKSLYGIIKPENPLLKNGDIYSLPYEIEIHANNNINNAVKYFSDNLNNLSLKEDEISNYRELNKPIYEIILVFPKVPVDGIFSYKNISTNYCPVPIPSHKNTIYEFKSIYLRSKISFSLLLDFVSKAISEVFQFKIETGILTLKIDELDGKRCKGGYYTFALANGLVPFSSPNIAMFESDKVNEIVDNYRKSQNSLERIRRPIGSSEIPGSLKWVQLQKRQGLLNRLIDGCIYPDSDYLCGSTSWNNEHFPTINKSLAKYFCKRQEQWVLNYGKKREIPCLVILMHEYINGGLVYQINGRSNVMLNDINQISSIQIIY